CAAFRRGSCGILSATGAPDAGANDLVAAGKRVLEEPSTAVARPRAWRLEGLERSCRPGNSASRREPTRLQRVTLPFLSLSPSIARARLSPLTSRPTGPARLRCVPLKPVGKVVIKPTELT